MFSTTRSRPPIARGASRLVALASAGSLALVGLVALAAPAQASTGVCGAPVASGATTTITCTAGGAGSVTVPADVTGAAVTLQGAGGGAWGSVPGGKGALVTASLAVTAGQVLDVNVGSQGQNGVAGASYIAPAQGGGLVDVTTSTGTALLTAGSGGGASEPSGGPLPQAGNPGGDSGSAGTAGTAAAGAGGGGAGGAGTATAGGAGGAGGSGLGPGASGSAGSFPNAAGGTLTGNTYVPAGVGGYGGAGYGSGGAGGGGAADYDGSSIVGGGGGSGGGGSSLTTSTYPGATSTLTDGYNAGDGSIVFTFTQDAPTVTAVSPTTGPAAGGTVVTVTGTNFTGETSVTFGAGNPATAVTCTDTTCTATAPAGTPGTVDVQVTTPGGTSATSSADQYTYIAAPAVIAVSPGAGPLAGGTTVTITGTGLAGATAVTFGAGNPATAVTCTATTCTATAPAESAGTVDVQVTTPGGTSATSSADQYTYTAAPTVTAVSPSSGPAGGGTTVTVTGTNLAGVTAINFGTGNPATAVSCTATTCTATTPAGSAGTVDVQVTAPGGTSATSSADQYTYVAAPVVIAVSPGAGPLAGGTTVTITGTGLAGATAVTFGAGHPATAVSCTATTCTATTPAESAGTVDVRVTTVGGTSATSSADRYTYVAAPTVTSVSPATGTTAGGTTVTITGTNLTGATALTFGSTNATSFTCATATTCTATTPPGTAGTVDVRVTTVGGTSATSSADHYTYVTPFTFTGFLLPVLNPPFLNPRVAGLPVPVPFSLHGNKGLGVTAAGSPTSQPVNCATHAPTGTPTATTLTYIPLLGIYTYNWKTPTTYHGTCQQFTLTLTDRSTHTAYFAF
ncbi:IPT/TIG domain-containing protein [Streptacidiphilus sp. P02-A3a]|uniref:IPT/TIG domain-containing protein n=1 Tax=Streptacidiphilus sp. P02-A3a TaxID=2704468 RepID=UPI0015FC627A|nr:IPT/TIG domain-containing protein [Streptacidiphilus sp. P02-A3a]